MNISDRVNTTEKEVKAKLSDPKYPYERWD